GTGLLRCEPEIDLARRRWNRVCGRFTGTTDGRQRRGARESHVEPERAWVRLQQDSLRTAVEQTRPPEHFASGHAGHGVTEEERTDSRGCCFSGHWRIRDFERNCQAGAY